MTDDLWSWPAVAAELRPLLDELRPDDALDIIRTLFAEPVSQEQYLAARLAGLVRGSVQRRDDEARRAQSRSRSSS